MHDFGYWSPDGMTWSEVKMKYRREVLQAMKEELRDRAARLSDEELERRVYERIVERACNTNSFFDKMAAVEPAPVAHQSLLASLQSSGGGSGSLLEVYSRLMRSLAKPRGGAVATKSEVREGEEEASCCGLDVEDTSADEEGGRRAAVEEEVATAPPPLTPLSFAFSLPLLYSLSQCVSDAVREDLLEPVAHALRPLVVAASPSSAEGGTSMEWMRSLEGLCSSAAQAISSCSGGCGLWTA
jgi:hypothetical protein